MAENPKVRVAPYGSWISPITGDLVTKKEVKLSGLKVDPKDPETVYWLESRPHEDAGRTVICSYKAGDTDFSQWTPDGFNIRTLVHEYGGGDFFVHNGSVYFSNYSDQRLYIQESISAAPTPLTPDKRGWRYADGMFAEVFGCIVSIREDHGVVVEGAKEPANTIVSINPTTQQQTVLIFGSNFYSTPRVNKQGAMAWVQWNHPNMPWDSTEIWVCKLTPSGDNVMDGTMQRVTGGENISVMAPTWSPDDRLLFISDKTNWWNLYICAENVGEINLCPREEELGGPQWQFGSSAFSVDPSGSGKILVSYGKELAVLDPTGGRLTEVQTGYSSHNYCMYSSNGKKAFIIASSSTHPAAVLSIDLEMKSVKVIRESCKLELPPGYLSEPKDITFPTAGGKQAHAYFYPPKNKDFMAPPGTRPPLLVKAHGGPTSSCSCALDFKRQFFTSRGFAILDVNYRGSTGYGRRYREELKGVWGIADVDDCCYGALYLANTTCEVDPNCLAIDGGSAGGYTTLSVLTFRDVFKAGCSDFGICDLTILAADTHKFESRYLDLLIGPYPEADKIYQERSPIHHVEKLNCPIILFQGAEDKVVPPNQAEKMFAAVKEKGLPVSYVLFPDEQHGFRKSENIKKSVEGEFYFFSKIFGFEPGDISVELKIHNLDEGK